MEEAEEPRRRRALPSSAFSLVGFVHILSAQLLVGCGGGLPLLHPAQTLGPGEVRIAAGFSASVAAGDLADAVHGASVEASASPSGAGAADSTYAKGALVEASIAPALAPFVAARAGMGGHFEGGVSYTGRVVRADVRHGFDLSPHWTLSVGAGGTSVLHGEQAGDRLPNVDLSRLHGWGADVPILVGYASDGDLYRVWVGGRGGWESVDDGQVNSVPIAPAASSVPISLSATRFWGGGLLGLAVGFRHVHVAMEIDISYASISGDYAGTHAEVRGLTLAPASSLWWMF